MLTNRKYRGYRWTVDTEDTGGQWIQRNSRYSGYRRRVERIQTGSGYRQTVDKVDAGGKWIQRIKAGSGYRETVDISNTNRRQPIRAKSKVPVAFCDVSIYKLWLPWLRTVLPDVDILPKYFPKYFMLTFDTIFDCHFT